MQESLSERKYEMRYKTMLRPVLALAALVAGAYLVFFLAPADGFRNESFLFLLLVP